MARRPGLDAAAITAAAARVADREGLDAVSMRAVGRELGVEAMSLYHHLAGKSALLDNLADWAFARMTVPEAGRPWRPEMTARAMSARQVLTAHPWALGLLESRRTPGPALLRHHDAVIGCLRAAGFPIGLAAHAFSVLDAYVYGFVLTELNLPFQPGGEGADEFAAQLAPSLGEDYPHLAEMMGELVVGRDYSYGDEFAPGLELVLDGLELRWRAVLRP